MLQHVRHEAERRQSELAAQVPRDSRLEKALTAFGEVGTEEIVRVFGYDSSVSTTRVTVEVFRRFGFRAVPLMVRAYVLDARFWRTLNTGASSGWSWSGVKNQLAKKGGSAVVVGGDGISATVAGHLVTLLNGSVLLDPWVRQAEWPDGGIHLPDAVAIRGISNPFLEGRSPAGGVLPSGSSIVYVRVLEPTPFQHLPAWNHRSGWRPLVRTIEKRMRRLLS